MTPDFTLIWPLSCLKDGVHLYSPRLLMDVLQLSKRGRRAMGRVEQAPSHAPTPNSLLMN